MKQISGEFIGVVLTGNMAYKPVRILLDDLIQKRDYYNNNLEVLFHPGGIREGEELLDKNNRKMALFYRSGEHEIEAETLIKLRDFYETVYCN